MKRHPYCRMLALVAGFTATIACAGEITLSFVDAERGVPLEYWVKESELANGSPLEYCAPHVFLDGTQRPYPEIGGGMAIAEGDDEIANSIGDVIADEGASDESAIISDNRPATMRNQGWVSKIKVDGLAAGEHTLLPGGAKFTVGDNGLLAAADGPLEVASPQTLRVPCLPVDFDLPQSQLRDAYATIASDGKVIHRQVLRADGGSSLRLYLPASTIPYELLADGLPGKATFELSTDGVKVLSETFGEANGLVLFSSVNAIAFIPAPTAAEDEETAEEDDDLLADVELDEFGDPVPAAPKGGNARDAKAVAVPGVITESGADALFIFTDRARHAYMEGERIQISLRAAGAPAKAGKAAFTLAGGKNGAPFSVGSAELRAAGSGAAADVELDTALLRPGEYTLVATCGQTKSNPFGIIIGPAIKTTNMKLHSWEKWGSSCMEPEFLSTAVMAGMNLICQGSAPEHGATGLTPNGSYLSEHYRTQMKVEDIEDGTPLELAEPPTENQAGMEYLLANGVECMPILYGASILYFNVGSNFLSHAEDRFQATTHFGMEWRRFPNFGGMSYCSGDGMTPATQGTVWAAAGVGSFDNVHDERMECLRQEFEAAVGHIEMDDSQAREDWQKIQDRMEGAWGFGFGMETRVTVRGEDDKKIKWFEWLNDIYPAAFREQRKALSGPLPDPVFNVTGTWGYGAGGGMHPGTLYRFGDFSVNDAHGDWGVTPFMYASNSDVYNGMGMEERGPRTWEVLDMVGIREELCGYKLLLEGLSRNPAGIGLHNIVGNEIAGGWGKLKRKSETLKPFFDIASRFGDIYRQLERADEVAVVGSLRQSALGGQSLARLVGAHYALQKAGWQANCIEEAYCVNHPEMLSKRFKALCLVDMTAAPSEAFRKALARFQEEGGILLGDAASKDLVPGIVEIPVAALSGANLSDHWVTQTNFMPIAEKVTGILDKKLPRFFETGAYNVTAIRSVDADLEYWTIWNDTKDETVGPVDGCGFQFTYQGTNATIKARAKGVLYDALRGEKVAARETADGLAFDLDFNTFPGTIMVLADRPVASLRLEHSASAKPGSLLAISSSALDARGKAFSGKLPVEYVVTDPAGEIRYRLCRPTDTPVEIKIAGNDPAGAWRIKATDQATGISAESTFNVAGEAMIPLVAKIDNIVSDADSIHRLVKGRPVDVLLFSNQANLRAKAEALAGRLREAGVDASFRIILPSQFRRHPMQWRNVSIEDFEFFDGLNDGKFAGMHVQGKNQLNDYRYDDGCIKYAYYRNYTCSAYFSYNRDIILLGQAGDELNPFLDLIFRYRMMLRTPSPNIPARGQGLLGYAWSPFHYGNDAIVAYGADSAGLDAACDELVRIASLDEAPSPAYRPVTGRTIVENGQVFRTMGYDPAGNDAPVTVATGTESTRGTLLPPSFDLRMVQAVPSPDGGIALKQEQLAVKDGPKFVDISTAAGSVRQFKANPAINDGVDVFAKWLSFGDQNAPWPNSRAVRLSDGSVVSPVGSGVGLSDKDGNPIWSYDPFEKPEDIDEATYIRECKRIAVSPDESTVLAAIYDAYPAQAFSLHNKNRGDIVWLETATGRLIGRMEGYLGNIMAVSDDNSRATALDDTSVKDGDHPCRFHWNPEEDFVIASFGRDGKKNSAMPIKRPVESCMISSDGRLVALTYEDPRRIVSIADMVSGKITHIPYPRADVGVAVDAHGEFALVSYSDSTLCKFMRDGSLAWRIDTPAPGVPAITADGGFWFAADDGRFFSLDANGHVSGEPISIAGAPVVDITGVKRFGIPPGLRLAEKPACDALPESLFSTRELNIPLPADSTLDGETTVSATIPKLARNELAQIGVTYKLDNPASELQIVLKNSGEEMLYRFPYAAAPREAAIPMRAVGDIELVVRVKGEGGASLTKWRAVKSSLDEEFENVAFSPPATAGAGKATSNLNVPRLIIHNVFCYLGDQREEQAAYGFVMPKGGKEALPPDMDEHPPQMYMATLFDGDVFHGDALYPTTYPSMFEHPDAQGDLRKATILMEFEKPRSARGIGIWEHPYDLPVEAFMLECCDGYEVVSLTKQLKGNWRLVCAGRGNSDYFHAMDFPETEARIWRLTIVRTPGAVQRIAEVELYGSALDELMDLDDIGGGELDDLF